MLVRIILGMAVTVVGFAVAGRRFHWLSRLIRSGVAAPTRTRLPGTGASVSVRCRAALVTVTCDDSVPKIVHVGPGLGVRGGVSAVERLIIDTISRHVQVEHIATMEDGVTISLRLLWGDGVSS